MEFYNFQMPNPL